MPPDRYYVLNAANVTYVRYPLLPDLRHTVETLIPRHTPMGAPHFRQAWLSDGPL